MALASPCSSLPMMLKLVSVVLFPVCCMCTWMGEGCLRCSLHFFSKGPCCFPYVFLIAGYMITLATVDDPTFPFLWVLVLWFYENLLDCCVAFKVSLYPILTTYVLKHSASPCVYGMTIYPMVELLLEVVVGIVHVLGLLFACTWLLLSPVCVGCSMLLVVLLPDCCWYLLLESSQLLFKTLFCTLLMGVFAPHQSLPKVL